MLSSSLRLNKGLSLFNFCKVPPGSEEFKRFSFCPWMWRFPAIFCHAVKFSRMVIFRSKSRRMDCSLNRSYINHRELRCDSVMIALKAHFFTCRTTSSQLETFNLIRVNVTRWKGQRPTGTVKSTAQCQRFFSRLRQHRKFPAAREKNLWYPRYDHAALFSNFNHSFELLDQVLLPIAVCFYIGN